MIQWGLQGLQAASPQLREVSTGALLSCEGFLHPRSCPPPPQPDFAATPSLKLGVPTFWHPFSAQPSTPGSQAAQQHLANGHIEPSEQQAQALRGNHPKDRAASDQPAAGQYFAALADNNARPEQLTTELANAMSATHQEQHAAKAASGPAAAHQPVSAPQQSHAMASSSQQQQQQQQRGWPSLQQRFHATIPGIQPEGSQDALPSNEIASVKPASSTAPGMRTTNQGASVPSLIPPLPPFQLVTHTPLKAVASDSDDEIPEIDSGSSESESEASH